MAPQIIQFDELESKCPRRRDFCNEEKANEAVENSLADNTKFLLFLPTTAEGKDVTIKDISADQQYVIQMHGIFPNGHSAMVTVVNVELFCHVALTARVTQQRILNAVPNYKACKVERKKLFKQFLREPKPFLRISFHTKREYQAAIEKFHDEKFVTFTDDYDNIQNKISRETSMSFGAWNIMRDYVVIDDKWNCPYSDHNIRVDVGDIERFEGNKDGKIKLLSKDRSVVMTTDIEVYAGNVHKDFVNFNNRLDIIKSISGSFHWTYENEPFFTYAITAQPAAICENLLKYDNLLIVQCRNEREALLAWGHIRGALNPQFHLDFNGGDFDTPWIVERSYQLGILYEMYSKYANTYTAKNSQTDDAVYKFPYSGGRGRKLKVENGVDSFMKDLQANGCVNIDVMLVFKNIHNKDDVIAHSLNGFLEINNLGSKVEEMSYELMDQIFQNGTPEQMGEVLYYNIVDGIKCQELMVKRNCIAKYRAMANTANVTIANSVYNADGMKCVNMVAEMAYRCGFLMSNFSTDPSPEGKFGGAYVPKPDVGPSKRPAGSVDYQSLYPSIMRGFNTSPEMIPTDPDDIQWARDQGLRLHESEYTFLGKKHTCYIIQHDCDPEKMGVIGKVINYLFEERLRLKAELKKFGMTVKAMEHSGEHITDRAAYEEAVFNRNKADADQHAVKILMNTIYGKCGDSGHMNTEDGDGETQYRRKHIGYNTSSQLYVMNVSSSITALGQILIKFVHRRLEELGCKSKYGDTDSVYFTMNDSYYTELDADYAAGKITKLEYWTRLVKDSIGYMADLCKQINEELIDLTKGPYIKLCTEGVKWPVIFTGKKKYIGIEHEDPNDVNFDIDYSEYMLKGIEAKKRGNAEILKLLSKDIIMEMMSIDNPKDMPDIDALGIVKKHIARIYNEPWDMEYFTKIARYKRGSANTARPFVERMQREYDRETELMSKDSTYTRLYYVPNNQAKFKYALVIKPDEYDFNGNVIKHNQDYYWEYPEVIKAHGYKVDLDTFVESNILTPCARFIVHYPEFCMVNGEFIEDKIAIKNAVNHLKHFVTQFSPTPFKNKYTYTAVRNTRRKLMSVHEAPKKGISSRIINGSTPSFIQNPTTAEIMEYASAKCKELRDANYGTDYLKIARKKCDIFKLYTHMNPTRAKAFSAYRTRLIAYRERETKCCEMIQGIANRIHNDTEKYLAKVNRYVMKLGSCLDNMSEDAAKKSRAAMTDESIREDFIARTREDYELLDEAVTQLIAIKLSKDRLDQSIVALQSERNNVNNFTSEIPIGFKPPRIK